MKFYEHPAYCGYAKETAQDIQDSAIRNNKKTKSNPSVKIWEKQFEEKGFDDTIVWSFDHKLVEWMAPRLKRFLEESKRIVEFDELKKEHRNKVDRAFQLLAENYRDLWI